MTEFLQFKKSNCKHCYKCIRHCPVKAISFSADQALILPDDCVLCGNCYAICPQNAKSVRDDIPKVRDIISAGHKVIVSLAPSYAANYRNTSIKTMTDALKKLGFYDVEETAVGATIVKNRYNEMVKNNEQSVIISSCCHSVNTLIQKHFPEALPYLAKVLSPMLAHGRKIKSENHGAKTVFIGPCISKKEEAQIYGGMIDAVLTFEELSAWLVQENIVIEQAAENRQIGKARLFPVTGGVLQTMDTAAPNYEFIAVDGIENCIDAIRDVLSGTITNCFIEMSACSGVCISGPAMDRHHSIRGYVAVRKNAGERDFELTMPESQLLFKDIPFVNRIEQRISDEAIELVLVRMGKTGPEEELNCGSCGYDTCREKAAAVLLGKAEINMCLPYLMEKTQSFSDNVINNSPYGVIVLSESFMIQQINNAACALFNIEDEQKMLGLGVERILDRAYFAGVLKSGINTYEEPVYLRDEKLYVTMTILYDKSNRILIGIIRDVTEIENARKSRELLGRKAVAITDKVIEKHMRTVQEIASLLGETTAETQIALTTLKETIQNE